MKTSFSRTRCQVSPTIHALGTVLEALSVLFGAQIAPSFHTTEALSSSTNVVNILLGVLNCVSLRSEGEETHTRFFADGACHNVWQDERYNCNLGR